MFYLAHRIPYLYAITLTSQWFFCLVVFVMAVWDIANVRNHDDNFNYDAQFYGYNASHKVPAWLAFDTFAGLFGIITLGPAFFFLRQEKFHPWFFILLQFVNWVFLLTAMALSAKYVGSFGGLYFCDYTIPYHHIDLAACTLPKVLVAVTVIALALTTIALIWAVWLYHRHPSPWKRREREELEEGQAPREGAGEHSPRNDNVEQTAGKEQITEA